MAAARAVQTHCTRSVGCRASAESTYGHIERSTERACDQRLDACLHAEPVSRPIFGLVTDRECAQQHESEEEQHHDGAMPSFRAGRRQIEPSRDLRLSKSVTGGLRTEGRHHWPS